MAPIFKFALIQLQPKPLLASAGRVSENSSIAQTAVDPAANFAKAESSIRSAAAQGCHLAVLPEYHLTSWVPDDPAFLFASADSVSYLPRYQALARELNINIVPGTICEPHPAGPNAPNDLEHELRNMAHFIAAGSGDIVGSYQKKNLWHPERPHLTSSRHDPHTAFDTPLGVRAGMLVCWDLAFPEAFRELVADGAQLIIIPSYWHLTDVDPRGLALNPDSEKVFLNTVTVARAFENTCAVVFVNSGGMSQVAMPILGGVGVMGVEEDGMNIVDVDMDVLRIAEENYKVREDMLAEGWHYAHTLMRGEKP